jgi:hypothetical protein
MKIMVVIRPKSLRWIFNGPMGAGEDDEEHVHHLVGRPFNSTSTGGWEGDGNPQTR